MVPLKVRQPSILTSKTCKIVYGLEGAPTFKGFFSATTSKTLVMVRGKLVSGSRFICVARC